MPALRPEPGAALGLVVPPAAARPALSGPAIERAPGGGIAAGPGEGVASSPGFHGAVTAFKRRLIEATLTELGGNRTRAARALGLQRTYLLRLMREFQVRVPAAAGHPPRAGATEIAPAPQTR